MLVGVDGVLAGVIVMADELRRDADRIVERPRAEGADAVHAGRRAVHRPPERARRHGPEHRRDGRRRRRLPAPVAGALFQEIIDLAVILNALRALRG